MGSLEHNNHTSHDGIADMQLRILVHDFAQLSQVTARIHALSNVLQAKRRV